MSSSVRPFSNDKNKFLVWEEDEILPVTITKWDLEFYENIKTFYPMMGGSSGIGAYMKTANCVRIVQQYLAGMLVEQ